MDFPILIADDSAMFRASLRRLLEGHAGWNVCGEAVDGIDAIQKTRLLNPDLVIMDLTMPRMSGIATASEIRKQFSTTPVILLTFYETDECAPKADGAGIRARVSKTCLDRLVPCIETLLGCRPDSNKTT
jgi:DNA-binding NarL/FixJ family response regulator